MHLLPLQQYSPDLVFLDVEMPKMNGFEMLEQLPSINFHLIFTTSYDQYALKAIRFSAIDYLLKPIDREELKKRSRKSKGSFSNTSSATIGNSTAKNSTTLHSYK